MRISDWSSDVCSSDLRALGVRRLDAEVVSHGDNDHAGGFEAVRRAYPMPVAYAPDGVGIAGMRTCLAGVQWQWDGVDFRFLHPPIGRASCGARVCHYD